MQEGVFLETIQKRFEDEGKANPDQREAVAREEEGGEEKDNPNGDHKIEESERRAPSSQRYRFKELGFFDKVCCLAQARQDGPVGHGIADPPLPGLRGEGDVVPVCQAKIERLENAPDKDREGDHEQESAGPVYHEGFTPQPVDQGVSD
jgi:hypothetical protein